MILSKKRKKNDQCILKLNKQIQNIFVVIIVIIVVISEVTGDWCCSCLDSFPINNVNKLSSSGTRSSLFDNEPVLDYYPPYKPPEISPLFEKMYASESNFPTENSETYKNSVALQRSYDLESEEMEMSFKNQIAKNQIAKNQIAKEQIAKEQINLNPPSKEIFLEDSELISLRLGFNWNGNKPPTRLSNDNLTSNESLNGGYDVGDFKDLVIDYGSTRVPNNSDVLPEITELYKEHLLIFIFLIAVAFAFSVLLVFFLYLFSCLIKPETEKLSAYECGFKPHESSKHAFDIWFLNNYVKFLKKKKTLK